MKVKETLTNIFQKMEEKAVEKHIFNFVDSELLDKYYTNMYGNRVVTDIVENLTIDELADILNNQYLNKWNNIIKNYLDSENILENYKEVTTETNSNNLTNENTRTNVNRVSAFNDDDFVNKDEDVTTDNYSSENIGNKNIIRTRIKEADFYEKVNNYLTSFSIYNIMIIDINDVVTLNILN